MIAAGRIIIVSFVMLFSHMVALGPSYADNAEVLPKGVFRFNMQPKFWLDIDKKYDPDGKIEDLAADFNANLNSNIFPSLAAFDTAFGLPAGTSTLGNTVVSFEYKVTTLDLGFQYGLTDKLTVGVKIPYWWFKNKVKSSLNTSNATVGKNVAAARLLPLAVPGTVPLTTRDVIDLIDGGLDINGDGTVDVAGFGFKEFKTFEGNGLSDIEVGFRYQYLRTRDWRLAVTGGVSFPSGRHDDPDMLTDFGFGSGAYELLFQFNHDYTISNLWKEERKPKAKADPSSRFTPEQLEAARAEQVRGFSSPGDLVLNYTFKYNLVLPDDAIKRLVVDANRPISANKAKISRDLGDVFEYEVSARYTLFEGVNFTGLYKYGFKLKDQYTNNRGLDFSALEKETETKEQVYIIGLSYSTLPLYLKKKFPIPLTAELSYRNRFDGSNNSLRSQYVSLTIQALF